MINETLRRLEERIASTTRSPDERAALLALLDQLRTEVREIGTDAQGTAAVHAAGTAVAAATPDDDDGGGIDDKLADLEASHPRIAAVLRSLMQTLADAGI